MWNANRGYLTLSGITIAISGVLLVLINAGLTPLLQTDASYTETAASSIYFWRQSLSALTAILLLIGSIGLYLHHADNSGRFGAIVFVLTIVGNALLLATEWMQIFFKYVI